MKKVLVAGGTGYLGRYVVKELKQRGDWVRALARHPEKLKVTGPFLEPAVADLVDDVFVGEVTKSETLRGLCDAIDVIISSVGITRQTDKLTYQDVDYQGNRNLLDIALASSASRFVYVHGFNAHLLSSLDGFKAKQKFVDELRISGMSNAVVCPTGFFNDMSEFLRMAQRGTVYLIGNGDRRINPIHGADLAKVCGDAITSGELVIPVGGPVTYCYREIAELAFAVLEKPPRIRRIPKWLIQAVLPLIHRFNSRSYTIAAGIATIMQNDFTAPSVGTHLLKDFYEKLAPKFSGE